MAHIPQHRLLPQDLVDIYDHGPPEARHKQPVAHRMHASDARHALDVDPQRWKLDAEIEKEVAAERAQERLDAEDERGDE